MFVRFIPPLPITHTHTCTKSCRSALEVLLPSDSIRLMNFLACTRAANELGHCGTLQMPIRLLNRLLKFTTHLKPLQVPSFLTASSPVRPSLLPRPMTIKLEGTCDKQATRPGESFC